MPVPFSSLADLADELRATSSRTALRRLLGDYLRALPAEEIRPALLLVIGRALPEADPRTLNVSGAALWEAIREVCPAPEPTYHRVFSDSEDVGIGLRALMAELGCGPPAGSPPLTIAEVYQAFLDLAAIAGPQARQRRHEVVAGLLARAAPAEAEYIAKNVVREMRHGVGEGTVLEAIAYAADEPLALVRRSNMLAGDLALVAYTALTQGPGALREVAIEYFRPLKPMLAQTANTVGEAMAEQGYECALEYKLDGARVQLHRRQGRVTIFSRRLSDLTPNLPEVVEQVQADLAGGHCIVEGEAIAISPTGRPLPFQQLMRRLGRVHDLARLQQEIPVRLYLFDALAAGEESLLELPYTARYERLQGLAGQVPLATRLVTAEPAAGERFMQESLDAGHEGLIVKRLDAPYTPGQRGKLWLKVKATVTVDLAVIGADWGYGRHHGWLSNYHLAARDEQTGDLVMVGKTFTGPSDEEYRQMTARLLGLEERRSGSSVFVRPAVVAEVAFNNVHRSSVYPGRIGLRFARILRFREDKPLEEIDTLQFLRALHEREVSRAASGMD